jgi:hypothetical protein
MKALRSDPRNVPRVRITRIGFVVIPVIEDPVQVQVLRVADVPRAVGRREVGFLLDVARLVVQQLGGEEVDVAHAAAGSDPDPVE